MTGKLPEHRGQVQTMLNFFFTVNTRSSSKNLGQGMFFGLVKSNLCSRSKFVVSFNIEIYLTN